MRVQVGLVTVLALLAAVPAAVASTARVGDPPGINSELGPIVVAAPGQANAVNASLNGTSVVITDSAGIQPADATCVAQGATTVVCPKPSGPAFPPFATFYFDLGDARDTLVVNLPGFSAGDVLAGDGNDDVWIQSSTISIVDAGPGTDRVLVGAGTSEQHGGPGNDVLVGGPDGDTLDGGTGADDLRGLGSRDFLDGGTGADRLDGGSGSDFFQYPRTAPVAVVLDALANDGESGEGDLVIADIDANGVGDGVFTGPGNDLLIGDAGANTLSGGPGNDLIGGLGGADGISGLGGNDYVDGGDGKDSVDGGEGSDTVRGGSGDDSVHPGGRIYHPDGAPDVVEGGAGVDVYDIGRFDFGTCFNLPFDPLCIAPPYAVSLDDIANDDGEGDNIRADVEAIVSIGGVSESSAPGADDVLTGSGANNAIFAGPGQDQITGGAGSDLLLGGFGDDTIEARDGQLDSVGCGAGLDVARLDPVDVQDGCETLSDTAALRSASAGDALRKRVLDVVRGARRLSRLSRPSS
jgi:Ca2+-binding RTX toxin-like protein